jgi:hypothetical protein
MAKGSSRNRTDSSDKYNFVPLHAESANPCRPPFRKLQLNAQGKAQFIFAQKKALSLSQLFSLALVTFIFYHPVDFTECYAIALGNVCSKAPLEDDMLCPLRGLAIFCLLSDLTALVGIECLAYGWES